MQRARSGKTAEFHAETVVRQSGGRKRLSLGRFFTTGTSDSFGVEQEAVMKCPRRRFLHLVAGAAALPTTSGIAKGQTYPAKPVRIVVGFPPGGVSDVHARLTAQWLSERLGQSFIIENRPGAGGTIAAESVARAPADGYTLLQTWTGDAYNPSLYPGLKYDYMADFRPIAGTTLSPLVIEVNPSVPAKTVPELIAYAKASPGVLNYASAGTGTPQHLCRELFKMLTGIDVAHVPYRGGAPAVTDMIAGQVQVMFDFLASSLEHIQAGKLRALAMTSAKRWPALVDLPIVGDFLPGFEAAMPGGIAAPKNTPTAVVQRLNREINVMLADPGMKVRFVQVGCEPITGSPAEFAELIEADAEKWRRVIRAAKIKLG
jgi:tripartite-type tricarboxylate transporter receptor subunit TctC